MKRFFLAFVALPTLALLSACGVTTTGGGSVPVPSDIATQTTLDERAAIGAETAYTAAAKAAAISIETGLVKDPATIRRIGAIDRQAYQAVQATRAAYRAGNASSYNAAFTEANAAIRSLLALL